MRRNLILHACYVAACCLFGMKLSAAEPNALRTGEVDYQPSSQEQMVPPEFRLAEHQFPFRLEPSSFASTSKYHFARLTFPSPVQSKLDANNTVHCEWFLPATASKERPVPGVVVLHILGGDFFLSRMFCQQLANHGVASLFLIMPHYGPRRTPDNKARMVSEDPYETVAGMRQAVLDIRRGAAWLAAQEEVDAQQLGIMGISLGGIVSALAAECEPRFAKVGLLLAGGDIGQAAWESPELSKVKRNWVARGETKESLVKVVAAVDPVTHAKNLHGRKVLMLNAAQDEVIPRNCTDSLWKALGKPEIHWWPAGHYSAARYLPAALNHVTQLFQPETEPASKP